MVRDFHTHTFLSDGVLSPTELVRRAIVNGYESIAITDHVGFGNLQFIVDTLVRDCAIAAKSWGIEVIPGVEITHVPKDLIAEAASKAKELGAQIVVVHGETIVEPVEPGTNLAALQSPNVDILAHPGLITAEEAKLAKEQGIFIEVSAKRGHSLGNGLVVKRAQEAGAQLILDSDAHQPEELLTEKFAFEVALGSGLSHDDATALLKEAPLSLLKRLRDNRS